MLIAVFFIVAQIWKQTRCSSVREGVNKLLYVQTMEYYSALKRNSYEAMKRHGANLNAYY